QAITAEARRLATLESLDSGKALHGALSYDLYEAANAFAVAAGLCRDLHGDVRHTSYPPALFPVKAPRILTLRLREPVGVVCELLPWNAPLMTGSQRLAAALAAGCCVVAKAPEEAVISLVELTRLLHRCGLPPGVLNLLLGRGETVGERLVADARFDLVSLTGGVATGRRVMEVASRSLTAVHLELGGKAPVIVFDDADLGQAVRWATMANFVNAGQVCVAGSRLLVHRSLYDDVVDGVVSECGNFRIGDALDEETFIGPLVNSEHARRVRGFVSRALDGGEAQIAGSCELPAALPDSFVAPTVLGHVRPGSELEQEEVFGPVLAAMPFDTEEEAVAIANGTRYGLNASVFTADVERAFRVAERLDCGEVNLNCHFTPNMNAAKGEPRKMSGISPTGIEAYTTLKGVNLQIAH
ncbi:MAG TPA: aldehyde dehydrogenase family protein, partial [Acidimicrobiales bacterium]|nr:aldehyde dehydrogenase family protein [Acidimicrobiales bacterium]